MAYFAGYPMNYPQAGAYQAAPYQQTVPQNQGGVIWVQGEAGMKAYLVAPNNTVALWDSENPVIYLKSADGSGMPSVKVLDYKIRGAEEQKKQEYVTKADFDALAEKVEALTAKKRQTKPAEGDKDE